MTAFSEVTAFARESENKKGMEWYYKHNGNIYISFSGGKDSTVLLDIARKMFPNIPAVYFDTGLEYPELREFVKTVDTERLQLDLIQTTNTIKRGNNGLRKPRTQNTVAAIRLQRVQQPPSNLTSNEFLGGTRRLGVHKAL